MRIRAGVGLVAAVVLAASAIPVAGAQESRVLGLKLRTADLRLRTANLVFRIVGFGEQETETRAREDITLAADVLFRFNSSSLTKQARTILAGVATDIRQKARGPVRIDGYTDSKGSAAYNVGLSQRRARAVRDALGATGATFVVRGHGEADPVAPNTKPDGSDNPQGRARNRRVTVAFARR